MTISVKAGQFTISSTGNVAVTGVGFQPQLVLLTFIADVAGTGSTLVHSFGAFDENGSQFSNIIRSTSGVSTAYTRRRGSNTYCFGGLGSTGNFRNYGSYVSMDSDGFTINVANYGDAIATPINYIAIAGLSDIKIGSVAANTSTGNQDTSGVGFEPDALIMSSASMATLNTVSGGAVLSIGFCDNDLNQCCYSSFSENAQGTADTYHAVSHSELIYMSDAVGAVDYSAELTEYQSDGFRLNWTDAANQGFNQHYIALKGVNAKLIFDAQKTTTGTQEITGAGFEPEAVLTLIGGSSATLPSVDNDSFGGIGFASSASNEVVSAFYDEDGVGTTNSGRHINTGFYIMPWSGTPDSYGTADIDSIDSNGITLDWTVTDGTARTIPLLFLGEPGGGPTFTTDSATSIDTDSAYLNGTITDMGGESSLSVYFEYGETTSYGSSTAAQTITSAQGFNALITGLDDDTTYHFKAVVSVIGESTWSGDDETFDTLADVAISTTSPADDITTNGALLSGNLTDIGQQSALNLYFEYGTTTSYGSRTDAQAVTATGTFEDTIADLDDNTTYHFRAVAEAPGVDTWSGDDVSFTTIEEPTVLSVAASSIGETSAQLNGNLTSLGGASSVDVFFGLAIKSGDEYIDIEYTTSASKSVTGVFNDTVSDLVPWVTYYFAAFAMVDDSLVVNGEVLSFTPGTIIVETDAASSLDDTTATLNGTLNDLNGEASLDVYFEYGLNFSESTTPETLNATGTFDANLTSLDINTEYAFRACATDGSTIWYGETQTFVTTYDVAVKTLPPSNLTKNSATLLGSVLLGIAEGKAYFEYGTTSSYGQTTSEQTIVATGLVSQALTGLAPSTVYHYRFVVKDEDPEPDELYQGADISFMTAPESTAITSHKKIKWLFEIRGQSDPSWVMERWSHLDTTFDGNSYTAKIVPDSFKGITSTGNLGTGLMSSKDLIFDIDNSDFQLGTPNGSASTFLEGELVKIRLIVDDAESRAYMFKILAVTFPYGRVRCYCQSILSYYLQNYFPSNPHPMEIWPSSDQDPDKNYCVPEIFGEAYIPLMSVNTGSDRYYVLGESGPTYTIDTVRDPASEGDDEYESASYTFNQSTDDGYRLAEFEIAGAGPYTSGFWQSGSKFLLPRVNYSKSITVNITNPADVLEYVYKAIGVPASLIDTGAGSSFEAAKVLFTNRGIEWQGGWWKALTAEKIIAELLTLCDAYIYESDKIELHCFSRASVDFITKTIGQTFQPTPVTSLQSDGVKVSWPAPNGPQDEYPGKAVVNIDPSLGRTVTSPSSKTLEYRFSSSSTDAQKAACLYGQKNNIKSRIALKSSILDLASFDTLKPCQVVTLFNPQIFRMSYGVIITSMTIDFDCKVQLQGMELNYMSEWGDLSPSAVTITTNTVTGNMT